MAILGLIWKWVIGHPREVGIILLTIVLGLAVQRVIGGERARAQIPVLLDKIKRGESIQKALIESAEKVGGVLAEAETRIETGAKPIEAARASYREAVRDNPTCAEWAKQPIACPLAPGP